MKCWSCGKTISDTAHFCVHCEAEVEEPPTEEEAAAVLEALSTLDPGMIDQMREIATQSSDGEDFVNRIMVGPCPQCDSDSTTHCEHDPDIEDPCVGRCLECGQLWCCDCEVLFADESEAQQHECPEAARWEQMLDDDDGEDQQAEDFDGPMDLDDIVESFKDSVGVLPVAAMRAAQEQADAVTPRLIKLLDEAIERQRHGEDTSEDYAHLLSLFLLFEFKAKEALPVLLKLLHLPDDGAYELIGDALTEDVPRILAAWLDEDFEPLDEIIRDGQLDDIVRWEAATTVVHLVRDGKLSREDAAARLEDHLRWACDHSDHDIASGLVVELSNLAMVSTLPTIERAYSLALVDEFMVGDLESLRDDISSGDQGFQAERLPLRSAEIEDAVEELQQWACFQESESDVALDWEEDDSWNRPAFSSPDVEPVHDPEPVIDMYDEGSAVTIRNELPRVGRNDACPCGSGKKYKKCCGRK